MARYIDADKLRPQELSNEQVDCITVNGIAVLGRSHSKNIKTFAEMLNQIIDKAPTEEVVPRSEVDKWKANCEQLHKEMSERIVEERKIERKLAKQEVAKQIFEEIENLLRMLYSDYSYRMLDFEADFAELKKKYIGG